jgi:hypothetical protein
MSSLTMRRLEKILPKITDPKFLNGEGIGNEISCYIFDYDPEDELQVRDHISWMMSHLATNHAEINVLHIDLLQVVTDYLKEQNLFQQVIEMQENQGDAFVIEALKGPLSADKIKSYISEIYSPCEKDLLLMSRIGSAWPMLQAYSLLNCLHGMIEQTPLVMFYPGSFDGVTLKLFGKNNSSSTDSGTRPYYRAFTLIPRENYT